MEDSQFTKCDKLLKSNITKVLYIHETSETLVNLTDDNNATSVHTLKGLKSKGEDEMSQGVTASNKRDTADLNPEQKNNIKLESKRIKQSDKNVLDICIVDIMNGKNCASEEIALENDISISMSYHIRCCIHRWGPLTPLHPEKFLNSILVIRGYDDRYIPSFSLSASRTPSSKQLEDYNNELVWAIRNSDLDKLKYLQSQGKSMSACNTFSESIVHMACRRADVSIVSFMLKHGADLTIVDDMGRTPLHDAFWRSEPNFEIVSMILNNHLDLLRVCDIRGSSPLNYIREEHWIQWCAFLYHKIDVYWPIRVGESLSQKDIGSITSSSTNSFGSEFSDSPGNVSLSLTKFSDIRNSGIETPSIRTKSS